MDPRPRLLVVDDDRRYGRLLVHLLGDLAEVDTCADGPTALRRLAERPVDWVLLDVSLPGDDGFSVLRSVRERHPAVRVVMHTGLALGDGRRRAIEGGAIDLLEKPLSVPELSALLRA